MNKRVRKHKFYRRWKRRFLAGLSSLEKLRAGCLRDAKPEAIHNLRVTLRRVRLLATIGRPVLRKSRVTQLRQWALTTANTLSRMRDQDVVLEWLKIHAPEPKRDQLLQQSRTSLWRLTRPKLAPFPMPGWKELRPGKPAALRPGKVRKKFLKERQKIQAALLRSARRFHQLDTAQLHEFRRALRRLRYLRELALSRREQKNDRRLEQLVGFQEALGEMQNCAAVRDFFSSRPLLQSQSRVVRLARAQERQWFKRAEAHLAVFCGRPQCRHRRLYHSPDLLGTVKLH